MGKIRTYPEMNNRIVSFLRMDDENPVCLYAAERIEELEEEVRHATGRWSGDFCSNCGVSKYNFISFNIVGEKEYARPFGTWNYCPRCGAKMEQGD